ncbi:MAG: serine/threonine protein kinase [Polyangiaceae bacterium]|nr:serine/threonine protein kinase [Polyangiaceae bacterium]
MTRELLGAGQIFAGRYRIERFLAEGGFGAVYVAEQLATEAKVAVKVLWPHVLQAKDAAEKFEQEARIAGRVNSDHIVRVVDAGFEEATQMPFLVMELLTGEDLASMVERQGALAPDLAVEYLRQTASALDRAHGYKDKDGVVRPIVHRDLKPENLFVARRDNGETTIKVLDFGIAKVLGATSNVSQEVKGTPLYMAFEQAGVGTISPQTDVWALGLIAFYLLTGKSYWRTAHLPEGSLTQLFGEVLSLPIVPPSQRMGELGVASPFPAAFDAWFTGCVNRDPNQRYRSAGEAIAALAEVYGIVPVGSRSAPSLPNVAGVGHGTPPHATPVVAAITSNSGHEATMLSARPIAAGTQNALAVSSGNMGAPKRGALVPVLAVGALLLVVAGVAGGIALTRGGGSASAASAATGELVPGQATAPTASATVELAPTSPPAASTAAAPPPSATAKPAATAVATSKPGPSSKPVETPPTPTSKPTSTQTSKDPGTYNER